MGEVFHAVLGIALMWVAFLWFHFGLPVLPTRAAQWRYWAFALSLMLIGMGHCISALLRLTIPPWNVIGHIALTLFAFAHFRSALRKSVGGSWYAAAEKEAM